MLNNIYEVVHSSPEITTVFEYIQDPDSPASQYIQDPEAFLNVKNAQGVTNRQAIENTYTTKAEKQKYIGKSTKEMLLKVGTKLAVEQEKVNRSGLLTQGLEVVSNDVAAFKAAALAELEAREGYGVVDLCKPIQGKVEKGSLKEIYPDLTVWIWCRSLASKSNNYEGEILNVTPFVQNLETNVGPNGGNFNFTLPPLTCQLDDNGKWVLKNRTLMFYREGAKNASLQRDGYVAEDSLFQKEGDELIRNQFFFHNVLSSNDLVFIRFETLQLEANQRVEDTSSLYIDKSRLPNRIYDMIGLIDTNNISILPERVDVSIKIGGTDLSKLVIEDGTYFYFLELSQGMLGGAGSVANSGLANRLAADGALQYLNLYFNTSIEKVFKFVINQLSNIKIVPDSLFESYGSRRNTRFIEKTDAERKSDIDVQIESTTNKALEQIKNLRSKVRLTSSTIEQEKTVVREVFRQMKRFLAHIRAQNVRDVVSNETVGWAANTFINERGVEEKIEKDVFPVYFALNLFNIEETQVIDNDGIDILRSVDQILDLERSKLEKREEFKTQIAPGIWQIVKLVIDKAVTSRRIVDSSLSSANGSLINFFRKICQEPFVEFYLDTYGDTYNLIVRKPPTDRAGILSLLQAEVETEKGTMSPAVIDIESQDVLREDLFFADSEAVSWYHLVPQSNFSGSSNSFSLAYLPGVYFPEYAEIWGAKPMQVMHNYMPMMSKGPNQNEGLDFIQKQAVEDMRYVIESTAYLPFTRRGTIVVNGDRRIKYGNLIRYKPTGEIFKVEGVKQSFQISEGGIDRITTIEVSRGMIEQLIYGIPAKTASGESIDGFISYFNIINTEPVYEYSSSTSYIEERVKVGERVVTRTSQEQVVQSPFKESVINRPGNRNLHLLRSLEENVKQRFIYLINRINEMGYYVVVTSAVRTKEEQQALRRANDKNAKAGQSKHEKGLAIDINLINMNTGAILKKGSPKTEWLSSGVPQLAESVGIRWGGSSFKNYYDPVHFEVPVADGGSTSTTEPIYEIKRKPVQTKALDVGKIFSNFKVNDYVFEFFLRKEQFSQKYLNAAKGVYSRDQQGNVNKTLEEIIINGRNN